ncbi:rab-GTPase-TBC domain-containing protein [Microdochium bolleyi]|uniref:Rab-GTPase-TBC domain-containing protein n=1 Tax=Microdochium bolleyi TaxID=196109 RepID=A0A136JBK7_9PEZI|nr:rab-GTPase-TBC domain-containing protein [Microdochium bolleyi]
MRSLSESTERWQKTLKHSLSFADLQQAVQASGEESPCVSGCRSICWKAFLLNQTANTANWAHALRELRSSYSSLRDHFLKYIKHPEYLNAGTLDPLADDADSPWNTLRHDQALRAEILQDVERLPDIPFYHEARIQTMILDILFIYCKLNPDVGGYRQGMHELLAPIVYVVERDAIDPGAAATQGSAELMMVEMLDASFIEHDSYSLFAKVMDHAKGFYEVNDGSDKTAPVTTAYGSQAAKSSIVEKSMHIHEVCLQAVDPELAIHLTSIEILPQIFLIRWVRLLFSREFPFDEMLVLWDTMFSVDPTFRLIDMICTAMLVRIRWDLLEADYSGALQLLLRYPSPEGPNGPHTFVDDAIYLRKNMNHEGGSTLIGKYTGRRPSTGTAAGRTTSQRTPSPKTQPKQLITRPVMSPTRFISQQGSVEALLQGAAKGVFERSEKLGINQAVRDAMLEIKRNVSEAKSTMLANRDIFTESGQGSAVQAVALLDQRNQQLADVVGDVLSTLKDLIGSDLEDKEKCSESLNTATARLEVVKGFLEDSTMTVPADLTTLILQNGAKQDATLAIRAANGQPNSIVEPVGSSLNGTSQAEVSNKNDEKATDAPGTAEQQSTTPQPESATLTVPGSENNDPLDVGAISTAEATRRPQAPNPTRSTIAQSSFAWMLEPDESSSTTKAGPVTSISSFKKSPTAPSSSSSGHRKRPSANANRERTAFLFGDITTDDSDRGDGLPEDLFGLKPLKKSQA